MRRTLFLSLTAILVAGQLAAATPASAADREDMGLILGALGGGVVGHQFGKGKGNTWATAIGAVTGAVLGQSTGRSLDRAEYSYRNQYYQPQAFRHYHRETYYARPPVERVYYVPSYEQRIGTYAVMPAPQPQYAQPQQFCREYTSAVTVGNRVQESFGTACLMPDGSWQMQR